MVIARGEKTYIKKLQYKDIDAMQLWGQHKNPLLEGYNFPIMTARERMRWYRKKHGLSRRCFGVWNFEDRLIGYIALRDIRWFKRTSILGIVFDPKQTDKGYGTDSLRRFLQYYFHHMKMKRLELKVAPFNKRAEVCYLKCAFKFLNYEYDYFEDQGLRVFEEEELKDYRQYFKRKKGHLLCKYKNMYITKEMFTEI